MYNLKLNLFKYQHFGKSCLQSLGMTMIIGYGSPDL